MIGLEYRYDRRIWLSVPKQFPDDTGMSLDGWAAGQAAQARSRGMEDSPTAGPVENFFRAMGEFGVDQGRLHDEVWVLVAESAPALEVLFVDVSVAAESLDEILYHWARASPAQYEPATVTPLTSSGLGEGHAVTRNDIDPDDRSISAVFTAIFRVDGYDVVLSMQSYDMISFNWAIPHVRDFADGISVIPPAAEQVSAL